MHVADGHHRTGRAIECSGDACEITGLPPVVGIEERNDIAARDRKRGVARSSGAAIRRQRDQLHTGVCTRDPFGRAVAGCVVDHDHFRGRKRLAER